MNGERIVKSLRPCRSGSPADETGEPNRAAACSSLGRSTKLGFVLRSASLVAVLAGMVGIYPATELLAATSQHTSLNRTLTPAQAEFLKSELPIDASLWGEFSQKGIDPPYPIKGPPGTPFRYRLAGIGPVKGICGDYLNNITLSGGIHVGQCEQPSIVPHKVEKFGTIYWRDADPLQHLDILKRIYLARRNDAAKIYQGTQPDYYWRVMAPIIRKLLEENRVRLREADVRLTPGSPATKMYAVAYLPFGQCAVRNRDKSLYYSAFFVDDESSLASDFNALEVAGIPFYYQGRLYFASSGNVAAVVDMPDNENRTRINVGTLCEYRAVRSQR